jgi:beta-lactamase regulating signal transducer with metallopeptidase domain/biopolymer transport protein ExbD/tetratricopeptide (TPR) repeat protein
MHALEIIFERVARLSLEASVLSTLIYVTQRIFRRWVSPSWRYALWGLVAVRLLMPVAPQSPASVFNVMKLLPAKQTAVPVLPQRARAPIKTYEPLPPDLLDRPQEHFLPSEAGKKTVRRQITWPQGLALVWALGLLALLARYGFGYVLLLVRCRRQYAREIEKELGSSNASTRSVHAIWEEATAAFGLRPRVPLLESASISAPALFGFLRPVLLIPARLSHGLSENQLRHVCFHEAAHLKRCDLLLNGIIALLQLVHWFNPFIWFAFLRMRAERELACDDMALRKLHPEDPAAYGRTILKLVQGIERQSVPLLVGVLESKRGLNERIEHVASFRSRKHSLLLPISLLILLVGVGLSEAQKTTSITPAKLPWQKWSPEAVDKARSEGHPVLVMFTADWDVISQFNRRNYLESEVVQKRMQELHVATFSADYTEKNDQIEAEIKKFKQPIIPMPLVVVYPANAQRGAIPLPGPLTPDRIIDALNKAAATELAPSAPSIPVEVEYARLLLETGKLDEAEQKLRDFLHRSTINERRAAEYYLRLLCQKRFEQSPAAAGARQQAVLSKLNKIVFERFSLPAQVPLSQVAKELETESKKLDPYNEGLIFAFNSSLAQEVTVQITPPLTNANLAGILYAIVASAKPPKGVDVDYECLFTVEDYGIMFGLARKPHEKSTPITAPGTTYVISAMRHLLDGAPSSDGTTELWPIEVQDARLLLEMGKLDEAEQKLQRLLKNNPENEPVTARYYLQLIAEKRLEKGNATGAELENTTVVPKHKLGPPQNTSASARQQAVARKLSKIVLDELLIPVQLPLWEIVRELEMESKKRDPDHEGVLFLFNPEIGKEATAQVTPAIGKVTLREVLDAIVVSAKPPEGADADHQRLSYTVEDYGVVFRLTPAQPAQPPEALFTRTFKLGPADFIETLRKNSKVPSSQNLSSNELQTMVREFGRNAGIDLPATEVSKGSNDSNKPNPKRRAIFFNEKIGALMVRATLAELDHLESVLQNIPPPPAHQFAKSLTINVLGDTCVVDGNNLTRADLRDRIQKAHAKDPNLGIVIEAGPNEPYANVTRVTDLCREIGIANLRFTTGPH